MGVPETTNDRAPGEGFLVLWAGGLEIAERDTQVELRRSGVRVEVSDAEELFDRTNARAPDLVVLGGELGEDPEPHAATLATASPSEAVPIVALVPRQSAAPRPRARFGLVARFDRELDPPALAAQLLTLLKGLATRAPVWRVHRRGVALAPIASRFAAAGRSGLLAVQAGGALAVQAGGGVAPETLELAPSQTEASFYERPAGRVRVMRSREPFEETAPGLEDVRVLVIDEELERREAITRRLERAGAQVRATAIVAQAVHASRALDPTVVVVGAPALRNSALAPLYREPRLVPAALLVLDGDALEHADGPALIAAVAALARPEAALRRRLREGGAVAERLETLGPARWLKLLGRCQGEVTLRVFTAAGRARVDLAGARIQGASFYPVGTDEIVDGRAAVDALMGFRFGRVLAGPIAAITALEGASSKRKLSVVGRIGPAPSPRRHRGLVAEEVVVKRRDATQLPIAPPKSKMTPAGSLVPIGDLGEDDEGETSAYPAETFAELRAALRTPESQRAPVDAPTAPPPGRARGEKVKRDARAGDEAVHPSEPDAERGPKTAAEADGPRASEPGGAQPKDAPKSEGDGGARAQRESAPKSEADEGGARAQRENAPKSEDDGGAAPGHSEGASQSASDIEAAKGARTEMPRATSGEGASAEPAPRAKRSNGPWLVVGIALALGVGGWAAWRLHGEDASRSILGTRRPPAGSALGSERGPVVHASAPMESPPSSDAGAAVPANATLAAPNVDAGADAGSSARADASVAAADGAVGERANDGGPSAQIDPALEGESASALIFAALDAAREHQYPRSEALARRALELSPRNSRAGYRVATALFHQRRYTEALAMARRVAEWDEHDPLPRALIGDIFVRRGQFAIAARAYRSALDADPSFEGAARSLERLRARGVEP